MNNTSIIGRPIAAARNRDSGQGPQWLITFADLAAVLVAFFVLMFSMSEVDTDRWNGAVDSLDRQFDLTREPEPARPTAQVNITQLMAEDGLDLGYLRRILVDQIAEQPELADTRLHETSDALTLTLPAGLLFETGGASLSREGLRALFVLAGALARIDNDIEVVGHADPRRAEGSRHDTNWELSLARAAATARALNANGVSRPIRVMGAGASRFEEIDPSLPDERRMALARRVDIVVRQRAGGLQ